jgi:hypothetical protein
MNPPPNPPNPIFPRVPNRPCGPASLRSFLALALLANACASEPWTLYSTGFEVSEGYAPADRGFALWDQGMGWTGEGSGGNGLLYEFFEGYGQQAYIGFAPPIYKHESLNVWRPLDFAAPPPHWPVLKFGVLMQVVDSSNHHWDDFRWSAYNTAGQRLFTIDFDNASAEIYYLLDDNTAFRSSGYEFSNDVMYYLEVYLDFARNYWQAIMNGQVIIDAQPITTTHARLDLSDIDAVWFLHEKGAAGDNYLLFDEYSITAEPVDSIPPSLDIVAHHSTGEFELLLHGEPGLTYAIDVADGTADANGLLWSELATYSTPNGLWRFLDETAPDYPVSIYRARRIPR